MLKAKKEGIVSGILFKTAAVLFINGLKLYDSDLANIGFQVFANDHNSKVEKGAIN